MFIRSCREPQPPKNATQYLFYAILKCAGSWNAVSWEMITNCYWKARFCEISETNNEGEDYSEVSGKLFRKR